MEWRKSGHFLRIIVRFGQMIFDSFRPVSRRSGSESEEETTRMRRSRSDWLEASRLRFSDDSEANRRSLLNVSLRLRVWVWETIERRSGSDSGLGLEDQSRMSR